MTIIVALIVAYGVFLLWMTVTSDRWHDLSPFDAVRCMVSLTFWRTGNVPGRNR